MSVQQTIEQKITDTFFPDYLSVENESHGHGSGNYGETHFKVVLVSSAFEGVRKVARHQQMYSCLTAELDAGVHALALHLYTPEEWAEKGVAPDSPRCLGGSKHDKK